MATVEQNFAEWKNRNNEDVVARGRGEHRDSGAAKFLASLSQDDQRKLYEYVDENHPEQVDEFVMILTPVEHMSCL